MSFSYRRKRKFRVYIVLPLLPDFENRNAIQAIQFYNVRSVNLGEFSIYKELQTAGIDPAGYLTFHGMRNWAVLMGKLVQEIVYVHSKMMIVDDKYVICGSANINDRSLLGKRDSELAAVVKDEELFESILDEQKVLVGKYANSLRKKIFKLVFLVFFLIFLGEKTVNKFVFKKKRFFKLPVNSFLAISYFLYFFQIFIST